VLSNNLKKLKIAVFSDLHIETGSPTPREGDINRFSAALITHWVNPDLIIWGGDITDTGSEYEAQIAQVYRYTYLYKYPVLSVAGNHDWPGGSYTKYLGPLRWIRIISDKLLVIGIYTVPYAGIEGVLPPEDVVLLEQALFNYSYIPYKIIVFHYPMFYYQGELTTRYDDEVTLKPYTQGVVTPVSSYWSPNMTAFRYVLKLIEDYNVTVVIAGHIHRDQFVKYTSTRTNTTTYFMTFTSTAHGVALYNGVGLFELDLESGELNFPLQPPGFTGFMNRTSPIASNSLPIGVNVGGGLIYMPTRIFYSTTGYKIIFENKYSWYNDLSAKLLWVFPWISSQSTQIISTTNSTGNASISILDKKLIINKLFTLIELKLPYTTRVELSLYTIEDIKPPIIELFRNIPNTPILNKTLTLYFNIYDSEWGVNVESLRVFFNGTSITVQVLKPINYISHHNNASLKIDLLVRNTNTTTTTLKIEIADLNGKITQKLYRVIYYPPGAIPTEHPIEEIEVEEKPTQTTTTTPTTTPTQTPIETTTTTPITTPETTSPSPTTPQGGGVSLTLIALIVILVVTILLVVLLRRR
jgi:predicted phosphodiesterase